MQDTRCSIPAYWFRGKEYQLMVRLLGTPYAPPPTHTQAATLMDVICINNTRINLYTW